MSLNTTTSRDFGMGDERASLGSEPYASGGDAQLNHVGVHGCSAHKEHRQGWLVGSQIRPRVWLTTASRSAVH